MSDFESSLRDALRSGAEGAPDAVGLAQGARARARRRRRTTLAGAVAVAAVVASVPVALAVSGDEPSTREPATPIATDSSTSAPGTPSGFHAETWRDLEIRVPNTWGYGSLSTWCADDGRDPDSPVVDRPNQRRLLIDCGGLGYGVRFFQTAGVILPPDITEPVQIGSGEEYPKGAWMGQILRGSVGVVVVARSEYTASYVLESVQKVDGVDSNGCAPRAGDESEAGEQMSVCRYTADGWLEQSELLSSDDTEAAEAALDAAPEVPKAADNVGSVPLVTMSSATHRASIYLDLLPGGYLAFDAGARELTEDVLYWALSPGWSGGVSGDVLLPNPLRSQ